MTLNDPNKAVSALALTFATIVSLSLSGCALDPNAGGGLLTTNAAKAYIYTPQELENMAPDGSMETMMTPSEMRERLKNAGKVTKPTGEVNYCGAGLAALVQSRRNEALAAIAQACGGNEQYSIRREGPGSLKERYLGNIKLTPGCTNPQAIVFRCSGVQPKPDMRK
jgi:hypothetical protein